MLVTFAGWARLANVAIVAAVVAGCSTAPPRASLGGLEKIEHIVVIYAENRSFDTLYGLFPGANGLAGAPATPQLDRDGTQLPVLPPVWKEDGTRDPAFPADLPNRPFRIDAPPVGLGLGVVTRDLVHRFYQHQEQLDGGRLDLFAAVSDAGGLTMGHYDGSGLPMWRWAKDYTLADNFFMAAFGGSFLNHQWLACACTPVSAGAPPSSRAQLDAEGRLKRSAKSPTSALEGPPSYVNDGAVTPDGYVVNTSQPPYQPSGTPPAPGGDPRFADVSRNPVPPQTARTLGEALTERGVSWVWYAGAWSAALADGSQAPGATRMVIYNKVPGSPNFQPHHQPYDYFARYAPGTSERAAHLRDGGEFLTAIAAGTLPQVSFYKPQGNLNEHPGYADVLSGDQHIADLVARIRASSLWPTTAIIVTYDENGGLWDHVPPPAGDRWGPGSRIPAIVVSPYARRGFVDHTLYDTTSIHKLISRRFGLALLPGVRSNVGDLTAAFDFAPQ
jgi:phospholipase C